MANLFSDILTLTNAGTILDGSTAFGNVIVSTSIVDVQSEPAVNDVLMYADFPSNAKLKTLFFRNDDLDSTNTVAVDIGIYAAADFKLPDGTTFKENDVILVDAFGKDENAFFQDNRMVGEDFRFSVTGANSNTGLLGAQDALWQLAGLTTDSFQPLRIGIKITGGFGTFVAGASLLICMFSGLN